MRIDKTTEQPANGQAPGEGAEPPAAPARRGPSAKWAVWLLLLIGSLLSVAAFVNLRFAERVVRDLQGPTASLPFPQSTSWATLLAGLAFTALISVFVLATLRQAESAEETAKERTRETQLVLEQRMRLEAELVRTRSDLDRRVQERTQELADSNKFLLSEIAERKRAEAELAAEKERLVTTLRSIGDGVMAADVDGRVVMMNPVAEGLTGWKFSEAEGKDLYGIFKVTEEATGQPYTRLVEDLQAGGETHAFAESLVLVDRADRERHVAHSSALIYDAEEKVSGVVIAFRDITEKRHNEEERQKRQRLESIALLAGGIAHDYNNLLTAILGNLSLAEMSVSENPAELPSLLNEVENAALRAKGLTLQLLTFAKGGAPVKQKASLLEIIKDSAEFVLRGSNTRCTFELAPDTAPAEVDLGQISQVIQNLVINADQAMPGGGQIAVRSENVEITASRKELPLKPGQYVKISIADTGPGIPQDIIDRIFEPYFTTKEKGSGLGLTTSVSIVKKHDGHLHLESTVGKGTTFHIYLPAAESDAQQTMARAQLLVLRGSGRVLVMDDDESIRGMARRMLEGAGYHVATAASGEEALKAWRDGAAAGKPFDAVILDLTVPGGMGGRECARQLLQADPEAKLIVTSGYVNDPVMERFKKFGFSGAVNKPFAMADLTYALKRVLG